MLIRLCVCPVGHWVMSLLSAAPPVAQRCAATLPSSRPPLQPPKRTLAEGNPLVSNKGGCAEGQTSRMHTTEDAHDGRGRQERCATARKQEHRLGTTTACGTEWRKRRNRTMILQAHRCCRPAARPPCLHVTAAPTPPCDNRCAPSRQPPSVHPGRPMAAPPAASAPCQSPRVDPHTQPQRCLPCAAARAHLHRRHIRPAARRGRRSGAGPSASHCSVAPEAPVEAAAQHGYTAPRLAPAAAFHARRFGRSSQSRGEGALRGCASDFA